MIGTIAGPLIAAVVGAVVGGFFVYLLSGRRARYEWLHEKRAEVIAELARLLSKVQSTARLATNPDAPLEVRKRRIGENRQALTELTYYFHGHTLWIDPSVVTTIYAFLEGLSQALKHYEIELNKGIIDSNLSVRAAEHVNRIVPEAERVLEDEFRALVYPPPWWDYPLRVLQRFAARNRKPNQDAADPSRANSRQ